MEEKHTQKNDNINTIKNLFFAINYKQHTFYKRVENKFSEIKTRFVNDKAKQEKLQLEENNKFKNNHLDNINQSLASINIQLKINEFGGIDSYRNNKKIEIEKLSEGEKNLIVFSYFISLIDNYKKSQENKDKSLIIFIDDPHSSLDKNNMNLICRLIRDNIKNETENNQFKGLQHQVFISTHNEKFLINLNTNCFGNDIRGKNIHHQNTKYFGLNKISNNFILEETFNRWNNHAIEYITKYKNMMEFYNTYEKSPEQAKQNVPSDIGVFIEELLTYLYPTTKAINISSFHDAIKYNGNVNQEQRHYNDLSVDARATYLIAIIDCMTKC